ncbi:hypothetical protein [Roseobacter sp. MH60115]|uniref:hypothetical protein n=1 Tax=Roseobacter sp. MH60115 TaxID=2785324 RepID=UPI0018A26373|nr:hypothetical protein [Roseobacter sp. MH60115]
MLSKIWSSELSRFWLLLGGVLIVCLMFVALGAFYDDEVLGQRGGALGVAISFLALFLSKDYGSMVQKRLGTQYNQLLARLDKIEGQEENPVASQIAAVKSEMEALSMAISVDKAGERRQNYFIAASASTATIFWGFGDWFVLLLRSLAF